MLSAIAARKARLNLSNPQPETPQAVEKSLSPSPTPPSKVIPKRRPANGGQTHTPNPSRKKRKKGFLRVNEKRRYFDAQDPPENDDGIIVDEDEPFSGEDPSYLKKHTKPRGEPLSILPSDSSNEGSDAGDEEVEVEGPDVLGSPALIPPRLVPDPQEFSVLSTFRPIFDKNVFHISNDEVSHLDISNDTNILALLLLDPGHTLALLGTYAFTVVHGCISLSGVTLSPSPKSHRVFAPRSSPIPVFQALPRDSGLNAPKKTFLPHRFRSLSEQDGAIVILQENYTGVKGLGRVCRTFDGVFEPSRWQKIDSNLPDLLPDVHLVWITFLFHRSLFAQS
jgi:polynucleotide 5'-hydroxyl-kinase GRC3/NOL9